MKDTDSDGPMSRRGFLRAAAGTAAVAGASGTAAAQEGGGSGGGSTQEVIVGPGGNLTFEPAELTIAPGTAVKFVWDSGGHNVNAKSGEWGHLPIEDAGFSYTTPPFTQIGTQDYWCDPHKSAGMTGTITVQQGGASSGGGSSGPTVPDSALTLGIAAVSFMLSTLGLAYFFMRYGGNYGEAVEE